jgi:superfamily II DNA helicase RecQ
MINHKLLIEFTINNLFCSILKQQQEDVLEAALDKRDCLVIMPTGGGKSGCFIIPGLMVQGVTFVISPLKALMFDQMNYLNTLGVIKLIII